MYCGKPDAGSAGWARRGRNDLYPPSRKSLNGNHLPINHQPSSINHSPGFTLIELLVVISIIALLLAILFPALRAGRSHARTAKCQGTLHQWGLYYAMYTSENDYKLPVSMRLTVAVPDVLPRSFYKHHPDRADPKTDYWGLHVYKRLLLCPEASALPANPELFGVSDLLLGRTHSPWVWAFLYDRRLEVMSSYGLNGWTPTVNNASQFGKPIWVSCLVKGEESVPVYFDCMMHWVLPGETDMPAPIGDAPPKFFSASGWMALCSMDRHRGGTNSLFMDWSVRKVGVKEPWTLRWAPGYNAGGPWTKQGGAKPEDWPQWMRRFKDY